MSPRPTPPTLWPRWPAGRWAPRARAPPIRAPRVAIGAAIVTDGVDVYTVAHLGCSVSAQQRSALEARGHRCEVPGCGATRALEIDHIADWSLTGRTRLAELCWLCRVHHAAKTHRGWRIEGPPGARRC